MYLDINFQSCERWEADGQEEPMTQQTSVLG